MSIDLRRRRGGVAENTANGQSIGNAALKHLGGCCVPEFMGRVPAPVEAGILQRPFDDLFDGSVTQPFAGSGRDENSLFVIILCITAPFCPVCVKGFNTGIVKRYNSL